MRIAMGLLGSVVLLGGVGWAGLSFLASGMVDGPSKLPVGDMLVGGGVAALGGIMLAGAIAG